MSPNQIIDTAFKNRPDLKKRAYQAIAKNASLEPLFVDIAGFVQEIASGAGAPSQTNGDGPLTKKRKLESSEDWEAGSHKTIKELSFSIPQRKKFTLEIGDRKTQGLRVKNPTTGDVEFAVNWNDLEHVLCLPVPEKAQAQYNFCVFPLHNNGIDALPESNTVAEQMLWTVSDVVPKSGILGDELKAHANETYKELFLKLLNERLKPLKRHVVEPDEKEFVSQTVQAYRKGEKAVHVKAFRGSKDGFLFFLPTGIAWVFKKPLTFFPFSSISSISYTSVLQRTFNLNLASTSAEFEFSMIDQADFVGIDTYIKRHGLQDASMAEQRRARKLNINGTKEGENAEDGEGELEKAQREAQDVEDEEEEEDENFDPGSESENEGSESSVEDEEEVEGEEKGDLVEMELGSEAEEVDGE